MVHYIATLSMHRLDIMVHLGISEEERSEVQPVSIDIEFYFPQLPSGCTDDGDGFLCYFELSGLLQRVATSRHFRLIEHMTLTLAKEIEQWTAHHAPRIGVEDIAYKIHLHKTHAPVDNLREGASFTYTTLPAGLS